jgi:beta-N-acetylhexosaminidase
VYLNARLIAQDLITLGITVDCAPLADLPVEGSHDVIGDRAFGHEAEQVIALARAMADGLMDGGVVPVLKHIPGHGRALADSHMELPVVHESLATLRATDFVPFAALADLPMAMTAHVLYTALDADRMATLSPIVIQLIREELGFTGLLMSDDISMKAMRGNFAQRARDTLAAGCDVVLHCNGDMSEMRAIAEGVGPLAGPSLMRAEQAMASVNAPQEFDVAEARAVIDRLLTMAA